jgi:polycystin 1L2
LNQETRSFDINWKELKINQSAIADLDILTSFKYTNATQINSFPYMAVINTYMGGGYVFRMQGEKENISNKIQLLKSNNWINEETAAIFVEFTLFNPNINLFIYCSINLELIASGSFVNSAEFYSLDVLDINNSGLLSFKILINIIYMCFIIIFLVVEIRRLRKVRVKYFVDFNNYIELVIIGFSWAAFSMYIYRIYASYQIYDTISQKGSVSTKYINLQYISNSDKLLTYFLGICTAFGTLRFLKLLRFNKRIIVFIHAFKLSLKELSSFGIVFFVAWFSFVQLFFFLYNDLKHEFSSLSQSMETCFQMILGRGSILFMDKYGNYDTIGICLFIVFAICIIFILMNIFLTIINESYVEACKDVSLDNEDPEMFEYLKSLAKTMFMCCNNRFEQDKLVYVDYSLEKDFDNILKRLEMVN